MKKTQNSKKEHWKPLFVIAAAAAIIFILLLSAILFIYKSNGSTKFSIALEKLIPLPAAYVKGSGFVVLGEIKSDEQAVRKFFESQDFSKIGMRVDFNTDQGKKRLKIKEKEIFNKLIENKVTESLARQRGIVLDDSAVNQEVDSTIQQFGNRQNLMSELARLYGWSLDDFKQKVVKPQLYAEKLADAYSTEADFSAQKKQIADLYDRVAAKHEDFSKVASSSSEGQSAKSGGDLGWSTQDQLVSQIADKAFTMKVGEISPVIQSPLGFHIIKLEEKKNDGSQDLVHLRQIFVKTPTFGDWLNDQMRKTSVYVFPADYRWNPDTAQIEFKDQGMQQFEKDLAANSEGDPSVFP